MDMLILDIADFPPLPRVPGQRIEVVVSLPADWESQDEQGEWVHHAALLDAAILAYGNLDFDDFQTETIGLDGDIPGNVLVEFSADVVED